MITVDKARGMSKKQLITKIGQHANLLKGHGMSEEESKVFVADIVALSLALYADELTKEFTEV